MFYESSVAKAIYGLLNLSNFLNKNQKLGNEHDLKLVAKTNEDMRPELKRTGKAITPDSYRETYKKQ